VAACISLDQPAAGCVNTYCAPLALAAPARLSFAVSFSTPDQPPAGSLNAYTDPVPTTIGPETAPRFPANTVFPDTAIVPVASTESVLDACSLADSASVPDQPLAGSL
jgi:hypothetical protein